MWDEKTENELREYAELEGTEIGELCSMLLQIIRYSDYYISRTLEEEINKEIESQLQNFKDSSRIVEEVVTETHKYKTLEWQYPNEYPND